HEVRIADFRRASTRGMPYRSAAALPPARAWARVRKEGFVVHRPNGGSWGLACPKGERSGTLGNRHSMFHEPHRGALARWSLKLGSHLHSRGFAVLRPPRE